MKRNPWQVQVELKGAPFDLDDLIEDTPSSSYRFVKNQRDGGVLFESESFRNCQTSNDVLKVANKELRVFSSALKILYNAPTSLHTNTVFHNNPLGGRNVFVHIQDTVRSSSYVGKVVVTTSGVNHNASVRPTRSKIALLFETAKRDTAATKVMRLVTAPDYKSWTGLYRALEVIEEDSGGAPTLVSWGWTSKKDLSRFKRSANSTAVAGDLSRHGTDAHQPPKKPMSIDEASTYLHKLIIKWLTSKEI